MKKFEIRETNAPKTGIEKVHIDQEGKNQSSYPIQTILAVEGKGNTTRDR
jgi:hypothetical protein